jgi:16S rRNA (cytosine967-C5)-methyltransferase
MPRMTAWEVIRSNADAPLRGVTPAAQRVGLDARDTGFLRHLVGTEVRRRATLRAILSRLARGKPNPDLACHLRLGLAQIFFLDRVPDHAAVSETVDAVSRSLGLSKGSYANGVLRSALRLRQEGHVNLPRHDLIGTDWRFAQPMFQDPEEHPFLWAEEALSVPAKLIKGWADRWGEEEAFRVAAAFLSEPDLSLRVVSGDRDAIAEELVAAGCAPRPSEHPQILLCPASDTGAAVGSAAFTEGRLTAELVEAAPGERVLDLCSAPGGKTAVLAATGATVVATDISEARLARLQQTVERLHCSESVETLLIDPDGFTPESPFDAVLVDAPCSNTGVLGARPGARWRWGPASIRSLDQLQTTLLERAVSCVRPGGRLIWSTCSLSPGENEQRVARFLHEHSGWSLTAEAGHLPASPGQPGPVDGGYAASLQAP